MKKNILTIIILAATLVNLTLSAVVLFTVVPSVGKMNNLITKVLQMIDLEIQNPIATPDDASIAVADMSHYAITEELIIPLVKVEGETKNHYVVIKATVTLNSKAEDYKTVNELIPLNEAYVKELIQNIAGSYTYDEVGSKKEEIKERVLAALKEYFDTESIIGVSFSKYIVE